MSRDPYEAWMLDQEARAYEARVQRLEAVCACGHSPDWHSHGGTGDCEHNALCACTVYRAENSQSVPE